MVTKLIGVKEFRQNMKRCYAQARKNNWRYVVMSRNEPMFFVEAVDEDELIVEKFAKEIEAARASARKGLTYSLAEVRKHLKR